MKNLTILRTHTSSYLSESFLQKEKDTMESFPKVTYKCLFSDKDLTNLINVHEDDLFYLITNTHTDMDRLPQDILSKTQLIVHPNSGYDHFQKSFERIKNIPVVLGNTIRAQAVAEYTLKAFWDSFLSIPSQREWSSKRLWNRSLLKNRPTLVFGHGHIGKIVASTLAHLGVRVKVIDPFDKDCSSLKPPYGINQTFTSHDLNEADAIILCCSLNSHSRHLVDEKFLGEVKSDIVLINGARGALIETSSLQSFLSQNSRAKIYLDVFEEEPFSSSLWKSYPQVNKTSHIAGVYKHLEEDILQFEQRVIHDFIHLKNSSFLQNYQPLLLTSKWKGKELI